MLAEPAIKRTVAFIDGQNLFHATKYAFGYTFPNFDALKLSQEICKRQGWSLSKVCFYTGIPDQGVSPKWNHFWRNKLGEMGRRGVQVYSRPLVYRTETISLPDGSQKAILVPQEKGVDIRLALDVIRAALRNELDVAMIFSQDQDLTEVADEIRDIAKTQGRWIKVTSAFPSSPAYKNRRGIDTTDWLPFDKATYDACIDPNNYFPMKKGKS